MRRKRCPKREAQKEKEDCAQSIVLFLRSFGVPFLSRKGAKPSAARGSYSEAKHGQNNEKPNSVQVSTMFCPWLHEPYPYAAAAFFFLDSRYWKAMTAATMARPAMSVQVDGASSSKPPAMAAIRMYQGISVYVKPARPDATP